MQDAIYKGRDNPVVIDFTGVDLTLFTNISVALGADLRTLALNPDSVVVRSATELELNFQDTTEGGGVWEIVGFDAGYVDGFLLTNAIENPLPPTIVYEA